MLKYSIDKDGTKVEDILKSWQYDLTQRAFLLKRIH